MNHYGNGQIVINEWIVVRLHVAVGKGGGYDMTEWEKYEYPVKVG